MFDIFYIGDNTKLIDVFPFAKRIEDGDEVNCKTTHYWLVEQDTQIIDYAVFDFRPDEYTKKFDHMWKWNDSNYGGLKLVYKRGGSETVYHNKVVCKKQFQVLFESTPGDFFDNNKTSTHVWCVDPDYKLGEDIDWAPGNFEPNYIHSFHLRGQLEHKYPKEEGGIKLFPREWNTADMKYHGYLDASIEYPVMFVTDVNDYAQRNTFKEDYVWLIDKHHKINLDTIDWVPNPFERSFVHCFRMPYQLKEKYPMAMGGIRLVPRDWHKAETKIHPACPIEDESYDVFYIDSDDFTADTFSEYAERSKTNWFWIVDREHTFNGKLLFVPAKHEQEYIHVFKVPGHLEERYPLDCTDAWDNRCGGIKLMNKNFDVTKYKYQEDVCPVRYDIFYSDNLTDYDTYARKSRTKMFWLIDSEHQINEEFRYVPQQYDQRYIQVFKFPGDLEHKYPKAVTNISDNRAGGIKLVPVNGSGDAKFIDQNPVGGKVYPIIYTDNTDEKVTEDSWIVPTAFKDAISTIPWQPNVFEKNTCHVFANGLLKWMPTDWNGEIKEHEFSPVVLDIEFEKFNTYEEGLANSSFNWFWVIDPNVDVLSTFNFDFQPNVFDDGKAHVWQKLNPITGKQYDYGGVSLRHKQEKAGRPKYIREPACTQREYPVYHIQQLDIKRGLDEAYERLASQTNTDMMWIVDSLVEVYEDFDFSYYPTQYDKDVVHIWKHEGTSRKTGVKLVPTHIKFESHDAILQNSFDKLKEMPQTATKEKEWPVVQLKETTVQCVKQALELHKDVQYVYTVDPDIDVDSVEQLTPHEEFLDVVHVWQRTNSDGLVIGHGGLRLWPTDYDVSSLTDEQVATCSIPQQLILGAVGGTQKEYPICELVVSSDILEQLAEFDSQCDSTMYWVVDPYVTFVDSWHWDFIPTKWEEHVVHVFQDTDEQFRSVRLVPKGTFNDKQYTIKQIVNNSFTNLKQVYRQITTPTTWPMYNFNNSDSLKQQLEQYSEQCASELFYTVDSDVIVNEDFSYSYTPNLDSVNKVSVWQRLNPHTGLTHSYGGVRLWPKQLSTVLTDCTSDNILYNKTNAGKLQYVKQSGSSYMPYDIVLITYKQPDVDQLLNKLPAGTLLVSDVEGIFNAHQVASHAVRSKMFWVVDGDADVVEDFDFSYIPDIYDQDVTHVWNSANPVTGDTYGYGGVKLFNTQAVRDATSWGIDFTTGLSSRFKVMNDIACVTRFNTDAYSTWRSAFRECVKLTISEDPDAQQRLEGWLHPVPDADFRHDAKLGAEQGRAFGLANKNNSAELNKINDYEWLKTQWKELN